MMTARIRLHVGITLGASGTNGEANATEDGCPPGGYTLSYYI